MNMIVCDAIPIDRDIKERDKLDPDAFAEVLGEWLSANEGTLPRQLALDGKFIGDTVGIVSLSNASTGVPVALATASKKEGEGKKCEMRVGRNLLQTTNLCDFPRR